MLAKKYAQALYEVTENKDRKGQAVILNNFFDLLKREGHSRLLPGVLKHFQILLKKLEESAVVSVVSEQDFKKHKKEIESYKEIVGDFGEPILDHTLIGGFKIRARGILIDGSYKKALKDLYGRFQ